MLGIHRRIVDAGKAAFFARRGEPYRIASRTLRFVPGTRPIRLRYRSSENAVNRFDAIQLAWIIENLMEGDFAIDVGANSGQCTVVMADKCGATGRVVAFEPNPYARALLERNFALNPSIKRAVIELVACSDRAEGRTALYQNDGHANSALIALSADAAVKERFEVPVTTLDAYLGSKGWPKPRFVKIDTEGAEIRILQGARNVLASDATIFCELHPYAWPQFGNSLKDLKDLLSQNGRQMRYLDQDRPIGADVVYGIVTLDRV